MIEFIILGGLCFVLGIVVGRHHMKAQAQVAFSAAMTRQLVLTSTVLNVIRTVMEKHGIQGEIDAELEKAGLKMQKVQEPS